jgi:hypothetical protein
MAETKVNGHKLLFMYGFSASYINDLCYIGTHRRSRSEMDLPDSVEHENDLPLLDDHASEQVDGKPISDF